MPWRNPEYRPDGYVIKKAADWDVIVDDLRYLKAVLDGNEVQPLVLRDRLSVVTMFPQLRIIEVVGGVDVATRDLCVESGMFHVRDPSNSLTLLSLAEDGSMVHANWPIQSSCFWDLAGVATQSVTGGSLNGNGPLGRGPRDFWQCTSVGQSLTIDLGAIRGIIAVAFTTYPLADMSSVPSGFTVDYSTDGSAWVNLTTASANTRTLLTITQLNNGELVPFLARYIRITVTAFQSGQTSATVAGLQILSTDEGAGFGTQPWLIDESGNAILATGGRLEVSGTQLYRHPYTSRVQINDARWTIGGTSSGTTNFTFLWPFTSLPTVVVSPEGAPAKTRVQSLSSSGLTLSWTDNTGYLYLHMLAIGFY